MKLVYKIWIIVFIEFLVLINFFMQNKIEDFSGISTSDVLDIYMNSLKSFKEFNNNPKLTQNTKLFINDRKVDNYLEKIKIDDEYAYSLTFNAKLDDDAITNRF